MKRTLIVLIFLFLLSCMIACKSKELDKMVDDVQVENAAVENISRSSHDNFLDLAAGWWIEPTSRELLCVENDTFVTGVYQGELDREGKIVSINPTNSGFDISVHYPEIVMYETEKMEEMEISYYVEFHSGFDTTNAKRKLVLHHNENSGIIYTYAGTSIEDVAQLMEKATSLPNLNDFEQLLNNAITAFYVEANINPVEENLLPRAYEISMMGAPIDGYDQLISCSYGPGGVFSLLATAGNGKVKQVYTTFSTGGLNLSTEDIFLQLPALAVPVGCFNENYCGYLQLGNLISELLDRNSEESRTIIIDGIQCTLSAENDSFLLSIEPANIEEQANLPMETNTQQMTQTDTWQGCFQQLLNDAMYQYPNYQYSCTYSLYDCTADGVPELFLKTGTCEADYIYTVYKYCTDGTASTIGNFYARTGSICGLDEPCTFMIHEGQQLVEHIRKVTYSGDGLSQMEVFHGEVVDYQQTTSLPYFELDDSSGLDWNGCLNGNNQTIMDQLTAK